MNFQFATDYNLKALTAMARALRKTLRKKRSIITHIFGWIIIILAAFVSNPWINEEFILDSSAVITWIVILIMLITLIFEDKINGYFASKKLLPNDKHYSITFTEDGYLAVSDINTTQWKYENIVLIAETKDYFIFLLSKQHGQAYDKSTITGGSIEEFRTFITNKTGKEIKYVK